MKKICILGLLGLAVALAGCVGTVDGNRAGGWPLIQDKILARYDRPADEIFEAAKQVVAFNGVVLNTGTLYGQTNSVNQTARTVIGKVQESRVWIRIEQTDPKITEVTVQARTKSGGADMNLASSLDKQIALKLVR